MTLPRWQLSSDLAPILDVILFITDYRHTTGHSEPMSQLGVFLGQVNFVLVFSWCSLDLGC